MLRCIEPCLRKRFEAADLSLRPALGDVRLGGGVSPVVLLKTPVQA